MRKRSIFYRDNRELPSGGPVLVRQVAALRQMGFTDPYVMVEALGLCQECPHSVGDVDRIYNTYKMMLHGLPDGMFVEIPNSIKCPICSQQINTIPCVHCRAKKKWPNKLKDTVPQWDLD